MIDQWVYCSNCEYINVSAGQILRKKINKFGCEIERFELRIEKIWEKKRATTRI